MGAGSGGKIANITVSNQCKQCIDLEMVRYKELMTNSKPISAASIFSAIEKTLTSVKVSNGVLTEFIHLFSLSETYNRNLIDD